ncbi:MAG: Ig-like domain-containing protein, partial [Gemmatimonadales bacterium]
AQTDRGGVATFRVPAGAVPGTRELTVAAADNQPLAGPLRAVFTVTAAPLPPPVPVSAARTGFVSGGGQRGRVGTRLPQPLVFEVRDANGRAVPGQQVAFGATNARLDAERGTTDAAGQVRLAVALGPRVGTGTVTATIGSIRREVTLTALAGPAARIVLACGRAAPSEQLTIGTSGALSVRITVQDALGNPLAVTGLRVAVGDEGVLRVTGSAGGETGGSVTLQPGRAGSTSVSVFASGVRENYAITVARGGPACQ